MMKTCSAIAAALLFATPAFAAPVALTDQQLDRVTAGVQPVYPGGFGQVHAAWIHYYGGAAWGEDASTRKGNNAVLNQNAMLGDGPPLPAGVCPGRATIC